MGQTRKQLLRRIEIDEGAARIPLDTSEVVHRFDDGWTVRRLVCTGDLRREGWLMHSCLAQYAGDVLDTRRKGGVKVMLGHDRHRFDWSSREHTAFTGAGLRWPELALCNLYSLRDTDNLPHATWWTRMGVYSHSVLGSHNDQVKASYGARIEEWTKLVGSPQVSGSLIALNMRDHRYALLREKVQSASAAELSSIQCCEWLMLTVLSLEIERDEEGAARVDKVLDATLAKLGLPTLDEINDQLAIEAQDLAA